MCYLRGIFWALLHLACQEENKMKKNTLALCEGGIMIAISTVLAMLKIADMPVGGSVTFAQMLPIIIFAYRHGAGYGMGASLIASLIQLLLGLDNFSYISPVWYAVLALALLDYVVAYSAFGIVGFFKNKLNYKKAMLLGAVISSVIRYLCHFISGFTVWTGFELPTGAGLIYAAGYNAIYMIPETIVLVAATYYICSAIDFSKEVPTRAKNTVGDGNLELLRILSGIAVFIAIIVDIALIFPNLQNKETGEYFTTSGLANVNWTAFAIVTVVCIGAAIILRVVEKRNKHTPNN